MLRIRVVSALALIPLVVGATLYGDLAFLALALIALLLAGWEYFEMARQAGHQTLPGIGLALIALMLCDAYAHWNLFREIILVALVLTFFIAIFRRADSWIVGWALTFAGALYLGGTGAYFVLVRYLPNGALWTILAMLAIWASDSAAYLAGKRFGRTGFFNDVSPKKTWEGAIAGWLGAIAVAGLCGLVFGLPVAHCLILGAGLGIAGAFGDLAESLIKRQFGAKDSGKLLPGHGGMLDRIDSLLFAALFVYYYLVWIVRV